MVFTAVSFTFIDKMGDLINPLFSLFFMALCATIWFNLVNYKNLTSLYKKCTQHKLSYLLVAFTIGINWLCSIFAPNKSDPFVYLAAGFMTIAICGFVSNPKKSRFHFYIEWICAVLLVACMISMHYSYTMHHNKSTDIGLVLGIISGISGYYYIVLSNKFSKSANFSSSQILALRFWPLIIILGIFIFSRHLASSLTWDSVFILLFMSFLSLIIPVFFLQQAITKFSASKLSVTLCITPVLTFFIYSISIKKLNIVNLGISLLITLVLILSKLVLNYLKYRYNKKA